MTHSPSSDNPWLVVIDMQNIFSDQYPNPVWSTHDFHKIIPNIKKLADSGRYADRTLITRFVAGSDRKGSWEDYYLGNKGADVPDFDILYDIIPELKYLVDTGSDVDKVVTQTTFNKWGDEKSGVRAKTGECPHLILTGVALGCCVLSTAMAAAEAGAYVTIASDACSDTDEGISATTPIINGVYQPGFITLKTVDEILKDHG